MQCTHTYTQEQWLMAVKKMLTGRADINIPSCWTVMTSRWGSICYSATRSKLSCCNAKHTALHLHTTIDAVHACNNQTNALSAGLYSLSYMKTALLSINKSFYSKSWSLVLQCQYNALENYHSKGLNNKFACKEKLGFTSNKLLYNSKYKQTHKIENSLCWAKELAVKTKSWP
jgi:hypothetical protein